jgi:hypothetical protein
VKKLLKSIFPIALLKKCFLFYNTVRIKTIDRLLFPEYKIRQEDFQIYRNGYPFRECGITIDHLPSGDVKKYMANWYEWTQEEFLLQFENPTVIEPDFGWALTDRNKLIYYSLGVSRTPFQKKPDAIKLLFSRKQFTDEKKVISLRDTGEENYFHFFNDVLSKIFFLRQNGIPVTAIPVVISKKVWQKPYCAFVIQHSDILRSLHWVVQDREYIRCAQVIFCKPLTLKKDLWDDIVDPVKRKIVSAQKRKIFVIRSKNRLRFIENSQQIEDSCRVAGFETVDCDMLTPEQQVSTFMGAEAIIGVHGAGLTNIAFSQRPIKVLEIFPPPDNGYLPYHYIMLSQLYGFKYHALIGEGGKQKYGGGFYLPLEQFTQALKEFLTHSS